MESTITRGGMMSVLVAAMMLMMVANETNAQIYPCWGGCYNRCLLGSMSPSNGISNASGSSNSNGTRNADPPTPEPWPQDTSSADHPPPAQSSPPRAQSPPLTQSPPAPALPVVRQPQPQPQDMISCYYQCLNGCVTRAGGDYSYYCQMGCNLENCPPNNVHDGAELEKCYNTCANLCRNM